jgi:sec-independent protein translocase protein TatB
MFGLGFGEMVIIAIVALLFLGPEKLPEAARAIGKGIRDLRKQTRDLQDTIEKDTEIGEAVRDLKLALSGVDPPRPRPAPPPRPQRPEVTAPPAPVAELPAAAPPSTTEPSVSEPAKPVSAGEPTSK